MAISLYKISEELNLIVSDIEEAEGEMTTEQEALFAQLQNQLTSKTDGVVEFVRKKKDRLDAISKRIKELQAMKSSETKSMERFEDYCRNCMTMLQTDRVEGEYGIIKLRKKPQSVEIIDDTLLDAKYKIVTTDIKIDKKLIAADLKKGDTVDGAELKRNEASITFGG